MSEKTTGTKAGLFRRKANGFVEREHGFGLIAKTAANVMFNRLMAGRAVRAVERAGAK
jgi:hypothetical protein